MRGVRRWVRVPNHDGNPNFTTTADKFVEGRVRKGMKDHMKIVFTVDNGGTPFMVVLLSDEDKKKELWRRVQLDNDVLSGPGKAYVFVIDHGEVQSVRTDTIYTEEEDKRKLAPMFRFLDSIAFRDAFVGYDSDELRALTNPKEARYSYSYSSLKSAFGMASRPRAPLWWHGGNSVLLRTDKREYVFVGDRVIRFKVAARDRVVRFVSDGQQRRVVSLRRR